MAKGETRIEDNEGSIDPELGQEKTTMFRAVAARLNYLSQDRPRHYVCHYEAVLKDVSAGRTRFEEHEESGSVPRRKATSLGVCLNGRLIQVLCTPLLTRIGQETDSQESRSEGALSCTRST